MPAFSQSVRIPAHVLVRQLAGESVLLNLQTERYFGLDEVGTRMWTHLTSSVSIEAAYQNLLEEYEVEGEVLRQNLSDLLDHLLANGLLDRTASRRRGLTKTILWKSRLGSADLRTGFGGSVLLRGKQY